MNLSLEELKQRNAGTAGADQQEPVPNSADTVTGWEKEREVFFSAKIQTATAGMDGGADLSAVGVGSIAADIIHLGKSVEQLAEPAPVKDCTTKTVVHERKKLSVKRKMTTAVTILI